MTSSVNLLDELPEQKRQPNLLFAAVRYLAGPVEEPHAFHDWVLRHWADVAATIRARRTQTNEPARWTVLLPVLARLPQPLALLEVGASAGLCLYPDAYRYRYDDHVIGPADSPVQLHCAIEGGVPFPTVCRPWSGGPLSTSTPWRSPTTTTCGGWTRSSGPSSATGIEDNRHNGTRVLRHTYASVLLDAGESVKALSSYLGHADPGFTLRIYTHLLATSEGRTRRAIDQAFADDPKTGDGLETA